MKLKKILASAVIGAFVVGVSANNLQPVSAAIPEIAKNDLNILSNNQKPPEPPKDSNGKPLPPPNHNGQKPPEPPKDSNGNPLPPPNQSTNNKSALVKYAVDIDAAKEKGKTTLDKAKDAKKKYDKAKKIADKVK